MPCLRNKGLIVRQSILASVPEGQRKSAGGEASAASGNHRIVPPKKSCAPAGALGDAARGISAAPSGAVAFGTGDPVGFASPDHRLVSVTPPALESSLTKRRLHEHMQERILAT